MLAVVSISITSKEVSNDVAINDYEFEVFNKCSAKKKAEIKMFKIFNII